jgi:hypothetical protein
MAYIMRIRRTTYARTHRPARAPLAGLSHASSPEATVSIERLLYMALAVAVVAAVIYLILSLAGAAG